MSNSRNLLACLLALVAPAIAGAQAATGAATGAPSPIAYSSVSELNGILTPLRLTVESIQADLTKMRIEKWKTDNANKRQTLNNVDSVQRNLQSALPDMLTQVNTSPENLVASFKLYRNLDALAGVFGSVVESAGAFGSKDDFQVLNNDMNDLETERRAFGERMQKLVASKEEELTRLRAQVKTLSAAPPPPLPKKVVVDDTEPPKKAPVKKKVTKPKPPAATTETPPSAVPPQ